MKKIVLLFLTLLTVCTLGAKPVTTRLKITNAPSKEKIERVVRQIHGVTQATYDMSTKILVVTYDNKKTNTSKVRAGVKKAGYVIGSFAPSAKQAPTSREDQKTKQTPSPAKTKTPLQTTK